MISSDQGGLNSYAAASANPLERTTGDSRFFMPAAIHSISSASDAEHVFSLSAPHAAKCARRKSLMVAGFRDPKLQSGLEQVCQCIDCIEVGGGCHGKTKAKRGVETDNLRGGQTGLATPSIWGSAAP